MKTAIYPGTFDPITNGHVDVVKRAASLFDKVIVAVALSEGKSPLIAVKDRVQLVEAVFVDIKNVKVQVLSGLVVNFALQAQANYLVRGLRNVSDFDYEFQMAEMNKKMHAEIQTLFFPAAAEHQHVSATIVRDIVKLNGDVSAFVPQPVNEYLRKIYGVKNH